MSSRIHVETSPYDGEDGSVQVPLPLACPKCRAVDLAACMDCGHCPAGVIANLTYDEIGWALAQLELAKGRVEQPF